MKEVIEELNQKLEKLEYLILANGQKEVFTLEEVAQYTGLSKSYLYKLSSTGGIPCFKPRLKMLYFKRTEIDEWLLQNRIKTTEEIEAEAATYVTLNPTR